MKTAITSIAASLLLACGGSDSSTTTSKPKTSSGALEIFPSKLYTGFDGEHDFKAPAVVVGAKTKVTWTVDDESLVKVEANADGTVTFTALKAGKATVTATSKEGTATAPLVITKYSADQWNAGKSRYTTGGSAANQQACSNCHGGGAGPDHTPTEIDADTDDAVITTFTTGVDPEGNPVNGGKHTWEFASDAEKTGIIAYLRSLTPTGFPKPDDKTDKQ